MNMKSFSTEKEFGGKIERIWKDNKFEDDENLKIIFERGYTLKDEIYTNALLFVGLNPSFEISKDKPLFDNESFKLNYDHSYCTKFHKIQSTLEKIYKVDIL